MRLIRGFFRLLGGTIKWTLIVIVLLIVVAIIVAVVKAGKSGHTTTTGTAVTKRVDGTFMRNGFGAGQLAPKILTSDTYCGWSGSRVIVHVTMRNTSAETATVHWHPTYSIVNGASHGTGLTSIQNTKLTSGQTESAFASQSPKGVTAGTRIARCYPSFNTVSSG